MPRVFSYQYQIEYCAKPPRRCNGGFASPARLTVFGSERALLACAQSALLSFKAFLVVVLLFICTSTYLRQQRPSMFKEKRPG